MRFCGASLETIPECRALGADAGDERKADLCPISKAANLPSGIPQRTCRHILGREQKEAHIGVTSHKPFFAQSSQDARFPLRFLPSKLKLRFL